MISQEYIKSLFDYLDGELIRKKSSGGHVSGEIVGWISNSRREKFYKKTTIDSKTYYVHSLVFLFHHGILSKRIDHIDGNGLNNKIENLRECTQSQNIANSKISTANTSGYKGVTFRKDTKKWQAQIMVNKKHISLGSYATKEEAFEAYKSKSSKIFNEFSRSQ